MNQYGNSTVVASMKAVNGMVYDVVVDEGFSGNYSGKEGYSDDMYMNEDPMNSMTESDGKDPLLSSWLFVGGITAATLAVGILCGVLLAKLRIKKGFDLYEI